MEVISTSTQETEQLAQKLAASIKPTMVVALYGDLGAGKTTFSRFLIKALGSESRVQSPTFVLARKYKVTDSARQIKEIHHLDLYRIKSVHELRDLDITDFFADSLAITIVEWPEIAEQLLPENTIKIKFEVVDDTTRKIHVENFN